MEQLSQNKTLVGLLGAVATYKLLSALLLPSGVLARDDRSRLPYKESRTVELSHGSTHYLIRGDKNKGRLVVLVHGFVGSESYFKYLAQHLASKGKRRVLCYDLYGRGYSSCQGHKQSLNLFCGQLAELLYYLNETDIDLVGYSMGGSIAVDFLSKYHVHVNSVVLLSPSAAGAGIPDLTPYSDSPLINNSVVKCIIGAIAASQSPVWVRANSPRVKEQMASIAERVDHEGIMLFRSIGLTVLHFNFQPLVEQVEIIKDLGHIPMFALYATDDERIPLHRESNILLNNIQRLKFELVKGNHQFPIEFAEQCGDMMLDFYNQTKINFKN